MTKGRGGNYARALSVPKNAAFSSKVWKAPCCRNRKKVNFRHECNYNNFITYAELRGSIDELELDLLEIPTGGVDHERLAEGNNTLLGSGNRALQDDEVVLNDTIVRETTHGCDSLLGDIVLSRSVSVIGARANAVNLLVELGTVVVTVCLQNIQYVFS